MNAIQAAVTPRVLAAMISCTSAALRELANVKLKDLPRLADFATWISAAEKGMGWEAGRFMRLYRKNRSRVHDRVIENRSLHRS